MADKENRDVESSKPQQIGYFKMVFDQKVVTDDIVNHKYDGSGTEEDPYVVNWIELDPRNPQNFPKWKKWWLTGLVAIATLAVAFVSSAYTGGIQQILRQFNTSDEVVTLGVSLFVLGFAVGPLLWAPMSELFGRQKLFIGTYAMLTFFNAGAAGSQNIWTLLILRFFAGAFGSSPLTNAGGVIADMFPAEERGLAMSLFAAAPFLGPTLGPIIGGFAGETIGWRWVEGIMAIFTGVLWFAGWAFIPETYPPVLLRQRAAKLSQLSGKVYKSKSDVQQGEVSAAHAFKTALSRPWVLLFREPIVFLLSIYMAIIYGTLYMLFGAFPIVYQEGRHWSAGIGGLAFLGVAIGMLIAVAYSIFDNKRYTKIMHESEGGIAPPEARLPTAMIGGIALPIGLFWFAWTNSPSLPWAASVAGGIPFGFGMVLVFLSIMNYLIDAYVIFAASVLAANAVMRSIFGAVFPLFTTYMYNGLGIHWASSIPAFLALACVPFPFLFYKYGAAIRKRCKFAAEADAFVQSMLQNADGEDNGGDSSSSEDHASTDAFSENEKDDYAEKDAPARARAMRGEPVAQQQQEAYDYSYEEDAHAHAATSTRFKAIRPAGAGGLVRTHTSASARSAASGRTTASGRTRSYTHNPYDIDRVNTRDSFVRAVQSPVSGRASRTSSAANSRPASGMR